MERVHLAVAAGRVWLAAAAFSCNAETDPEASANQLPRRVWRLSADPQPGCNVVVIVATEMCFTLN